MKLLYFSDLKSKGITWTRDHLRQKCRRGEFPNPVRLSPRRLAWLESDVDAWIAKCITARDEHAA